VSRRRTYTLLLALVLTSVPMMWLGWRWTTSDDEHPLDHSVTVKVQVNGAKDRANLVRNDDGSYSYILWKSANDSERLTPDQLAGRIFDQQQGAGFLATVFNISSPIGLIWIGVGLLGQVLFTGRMVVQWLASEKNRKSIVPPMFWWMSLAGAMMLLSYFIWRRDVIGVLGQSFGVFIYIRNLHLIYKERRTILVTADPAPEPELG
jgi:lipid-A-disaccharide synthase-like uncharacterized protein